MMIAQNIVHAIPVTNVVTKAIKTMACKLGFMSLKFKNRHGVIFHDADWIAGVDDEDDEDDKEEDDDEEFQLENADDKTRKNLKCKNIQQFHMRKRING
jgi:hypothetical protein